ncbi:prepilin-type N-terminal cleavage/methylation domain-containing protein [Parahaliea maris]|uniref:Prepilin-type N-terminal cleavage/methylation domain-containing protein n=1 Tax=Parahaliea maris TaxID=2716870 RepID=A0A5C8ZSA2_9GAMM|nr:prepilin-type N-terminal cleavage/methylation domain-containing protein [Parahaliea maris]TXS91326.1 prepilin-type N-terminal cleavage/methylation domain-containing protein [Parahaliea maris]
MAGSAPRLPRATMPGFTLVEVVVALSILSMIMLATVTALRTFGRTQATLQSVTERVDEVRLGSSLLRDLVASAVVGTEGGSGGLGLGGSGGSSRQALMRGDDDSVIWRATVLFGESYGGAYVLRLGRADDELVLAWSDQPDLPEDIDWSRAPSKTVVSGLQDFSVGYREAYGEPWTSEWTGEGTPLLVRFRIKTRDRYWPDLVALVPGK